MSTYAQMYAALTTKQVLVYPEVSKENGTLRIAVYKNKAGITGALNAIQLGALGQTIESLPVVVDADVLAAAIRTGYQGRFDMQYFDFILTAHKEEVEARITQLGTVFSFRGSVQAFENLPSTGMKAGYVYQVADDDYAEYVYIEETVGEVTTGHWELFGKNTTWDTTRTIVAKAPIEISRVKTASGTVEAPVHLAVGKHYVCSAALIGILPAASAVEVGACIRVSTLAAVVGSSVLPNSETDNTIKGATDAIALDAEKDVTFVYDGSNDWIAV